MHECVTESDTKTQMTGRGSSFHFDDDVCGRISLLWKSLLFPYCCFQKSSKVFNQLRLTNNEILFEQTLS